MQSQQGIGLILALVGLAAVSGLAASVVLVATSENRIGTNHRHAIQMLYAAESAAEHVLDELGALPDWNRVLNGRQRSRLYSSDRLQQLADGAQLDLARVDVTTYAVGPRGRVERSPRQWRRFLDASFDELVQSRTPSIWHVAVWVADDLVDGDGDATVDANDTVVLYAACFGPGLAQRAVRVVARRRAPGWVEALSWEVVR